MEVNTLKDRNVAIDARYLKRKDVGIGRYLARSVVNLIEAGANVILLLDDRHSCAELKKEYPSATVIPVLGRGGFLWEQRTLCKHLRCARYDAFIAPANYGLPFAYRGPSKLILVVHDLIPLRLPRLYLLNRPLWATIYLISTGIAVAKADRIIAVSDSSARDIASLLHRKQVSVVYPEITQPYPKKEGGSGRLIGAELGDYFVYNGGADPRKNVAMLLRAVALLRDRLPKVRLVILGTGYKYFEDMIENLGIGDRVHLLGYVSESEKAEILSNAVGLVYPSRYEGFGMPIMEGMAAGIPVLTGTGGSLVEVGGDAVMYVRPLNEWQLASAMVEAMEDNIKERARTAGRERLAELTRRQQETTLVDVVAAVLG